MKRQSTKTGSPRKPVVSKTNSLQRNGQTMTILFGHKQPGPSVDMLFEDVDLEALSKADSNRKAR